MKLPKRINRFIGALAGLMLSLAGKAGRRPRPTPAELKEAEFKTSTQRLGLRFTERIREVFRFRWLKKVPKHQNTT